MKFPVTIKVTPAHIDFLQARRIFTSRRGLAKDSWLQSGANLAFKCPVEIEPYSEFQFGPRLFSMGSFSYSRTSFEAGVSVGRYTVIADKVAIMQHSHPTDRLTFANIDYDTHHACYVEAIKDSGKPALAGSPWDNLPRASVQIGHSCWIGSDVLLKRNVKIGHGSIIAARSVVTKDVPPFTLVAGNPAVPRGKHDGRRYPAELIERLLASEWWGYRFTDFHGLDTTDPARFLDGFEPAVQRGDLQPWSPQPVSIADLQSIA